MTHAEVLKQWFEEIWCQGNLDEIENLLACDRGLGGLVGENPLPIEDIRAFVLALRSLVDDISFRMTQCMEDGEWIAARFAVSMTAPDRVDYFDVHGQVFMRVRDEKILESHSTFDYLTLFENLGQMPADVLPISMTGQKLIWRDSKLAETS